MMGYGVRQPYAAGFPGQMFMMGSAGHDSYMATRLPPPPKAVISEPNMTAARDAVMVTNVPSMTGGHSQTGDTVARPFVSSGSAAPGTPVASASKSKQGLEKILDTLSKMFPDVRRCVEVII